MKLNPHKPRDFLNPLLSRKSNVNPADFEKFKSKLAQYRAEIDEQHKKNQSEPNIVTNALKPFLDAIGYKTNSHSQKGQSGIDLTILKNSVPSVLFELKKHKSPDMITCEKPNEKAFHEAVLYFMRERTIGNQSIFHIVISDFYSWFIFDAKDFERLFWKDNTIRKLYESHINPSLLGDTTNEFYTSLKEEIKKLKKSLLDDEHIDCAYFDIRTIKTEKELLATYKLLSPDTLLKEFNPNDANSLNREFYNELLYILGLEESKSNGKKIIDRAKESQSGSLFENIRSKLLQHKKKSDFETTIKLIIIWINRILFLKLLESQIIKWSQNKDHKFLRPDKISTYDQLEELFFDILANPINQRNTTKLEYIPYLNSSLFEIHDDEKSSITIAALSDTAEIDYYPKTVVKNEHSKRKTGSTTTLTYLFEFLDAYDFGNDSNEEITTESKALINASVLGLIFEKINGYRDGSFYTPSFITMYMVRETIQKTILSKFNLAFEDLEAKHWSELRRYCDKHNHKDEFAEKASTLIDSITICDPAVGSGHFLVSALNEIIFTKHDLGLFHQKGLQIELVNDELLIKLDGEWFEYKRPSDFKSPNHHLQKTLFEEKQRIIENQLFGVDINPNSTQITKLRLWIELLKHSFYDTNHQLVTLPNIDINIKTGNSLVSRFDLADTISEKPIKEEIANYKLKVKQYKENVGSKHEVIKTITSLKEKFNDTLKSRHKRIKELDQKLREFVKTFDYSELNKDLRTRAFEATYRQSDLFGADPTIAQLKKPKKAEMLSELNKLYEIAKEFEDGVIYEHAFEWRFEFPEVLDDNGDYVGFDIILGNPPYFNIDSYGAGSLMSRYLPQNYQDIYMDKSDILFYFIAKAASITKSRTAFIISNAMLFSEKAKKLRKFISANHPIEKIINFDKYQVFEEASITAMMIFLNKEHHAPAKAINFTEDNYDKTHINARLCSSDSFFDITFNGDSVFALANDTTSKLNIKIDGAHDTLGSLLKVGSGMQTGKNDVFCLDELPANLDTNTDYIKKRISGNVIKKYVHSEPLEKILYVEDELDFYKLPKPIQCHFELNRSKLEGRAEIKRNKNRAWWKYTFPMHKDLYIFPKIWCSYRAKENIFCLDESSDYVGLTNTTVIFSTSSELNIKYVLALLNSKTLNFRYKSIGKQTGGGIFEYFENQVSKLPIPLIPEAEQTLFINLINKILDKKSHAPDADTSELEDEIDNLVYELYQLSQEDVAAIEERLAQ